MARQVDIKSTQLDRKSTQQKYFNLIFHIKLHTYCERLQNNVKLVTMLASVSGGPLTNWRPVPPKLPPVERGRRQREWPLRRVRCSKVVGLDSEQWLFGEAMSHLVFREESRALTTLQTHMGTNDFYPRKLRFYRRKAKMPLKWSPLVVSLPPQPPSPRFVLPDSA